MEGDEKQCFVKNTINSLTYHDKYTQIGLTKTVYTNIKSVPEGAV